MKLSKIFTNPQTVVIIVCVAINLLVILWVGLSQNSLPPEVPLFYGMPMGEEQLASSSLLVLPAVIALILIAINFLLLKVSRDQFLQNVLVSTMVVITALSSITITKIVLLVG